MCYEIYWLITKKMMSCNRFFLEGYGENSDTNGEGEVCDMAHMSGR